MSFLDKLKAGLGKTKNNINEKFNDVFSNFRKVDEELLEELEETLIMSDIGMDTSVKIIDNLRNTIKLKNVQHFAIQLILFFFCVVTCVEVVEKFFLAHVTNSEVIKSITFSIEVSVEHC